MNSAKQEAKFPQKLSGLTMMLFDINKELEDFAEVLVGQRKVGETANSQERDTSYSLIDKIEYDIDESVDLAKSIRSSINRIKERF